jgi:hypothetical protein
MAQSTNAMFMYGVPLSEDVDLDMLYDEDDEDAPSSGPAYMAVNREAEDGCEIIEHCSGECPMYFVIIEGTCVTANRGYPKIVATRKPEADWPERLRAFCAKHKLPCDGKPGWYIASMWN